MDPTNSVALVSGGSSGLGLGTVRELASQGCKVVVMDLAEPPQDILASGSVTFVRGDVSDPNDAQKAVESASSRGELRVLVHTAGVGGPLRIVDRDGRPGDRAVFERMISINLLGTYYLLSNAAAAMSKLEPVDGERGVCVLTASIAAYDGRIGQVHYAASKNGVVGMTLPAARDLASKLIRVCTIAPGSFETQLLDNLPAHTRELLGNETPHPKRFGQPSEFASLAMHIVSNPMLNGETIRLDGALRMSPAPPRART